MNTLYNKLKNTLEEFLKDKQPKIEPSSPNTAPLFLLLTVKPDLVGFATLDGQPQENFSEAFQKFKELYSIHSSEWADLDLTLVLCKTDTERIPDEFRNEIEAEPYFCRKFVIDLTGDLSIELGRLPFIPLRPETIVGLTRPISAQTFLMKHGTTSDLARYLVVPHAKGIERIIKECIKGVLGKPEWFGAKIEEYLVPQYEIGSVVRLKQLEIRNFRAYHGSFEFDLDADLIVLYGPNGFGKTSFFDAIDFVSTGGVARFDERFGRKTDRLLKTLKHLDSSINDCFAKVKALTVGREVTIERYMKDRTNTYVDGNMSDRTKSLMLLAGLSEKPPDIRIGNLVRLFRATHLFGQEYQSLTSGFRDYSRLPEDTVSRMLALQDYVEAINKAKEVYEDLNRQIRRKESEVDFLKEFLRSKEVEIEQLSMSAKIVEKPEAISSMGKDIGQKIIQVIGVPIEIPKEFSKEIIREWRTKIAVQNSYITQNLELIEKLESKFPELVNHRKKLQEKSLKLTQKKRLLSKLNKDYSNGEKELEASNAKLKRMFPEEGNLSSKRENLNWLLQAKVEYQQFEEQVVKENKNHRDIQAKLLELSPKIEKLQFEKKASEETIGKVTLEIKILKNRLKEFSDFEKSAGNWLKIAKRYKELKVYLQSIGQEVDNMKNKLRSKKDELNAAIIGRNKLRKHIDDLQQNQSELRTLLDNIERHILNNICPVCGTEHKSREELIEKLKFQRGIQLKGIQEALKLLEDVNAKTNELEKHVSDLQLKLKQSEQKLAETQKELLDMEERIKTYEEKAISLDIAITPENSLDVIDSKKKKVLEQITIKQQELFAQKNKTEMLQKELTTLVNQQESLVQNLQIIKSKQDQLTLVISQISNDALTRQVSLELKKEMIQEELTKTNNNFEDLHKQIEIQRSKNQNLEKDISSILSKKNVLEREIQELDDEILNSRKYIEEVESLINRLKLNLDIDIKQIIVLKKEFMELLSSLDSLQNEVTNFEIALDSVETSAALAKIQHDIKNINKQIQDLREKQDRLKSWVSYFGIIYKELEFLQNQVLKEYTEKYGPLTSTIQSRLRSVYGFGDIRIHPENGGIAVRVDREGEKDISPSDYFSESQIQIVMLSLFLSATLTQTWSSFAPILLDDPVGHFDDLNAYSFLDLIKGVITESSGQHQFIISTCEERLFRLMLQKFNRMNSRAIFYVFESIGENGPKVKRL